MAAPAPIGERGAVPSSETAPIRESTTMPSSETAPIGESGSTLDNGEMKNPPSPPVPNLGHALNSRGEAAHSNLGLVLNSVSESRNPLCRTEELATRLMHEAVSTGSETSIEIASSAIKIFCQCALEWTKKILEEHKASLPSPPAGGEAALQLESWKPLVETAPIMMGDVLGAPQDAKKARETPQEIIKKAITAAVYDEAANRILKDLEATMGPDFETELSGGGTDAASVAHAASIANLRAHIVSRDALDDRMQVLLTEMVGACTDITDELLNSSEFRLDLAEWGIADLAPRT